MIIQTGQKYNNKEGIVEMNFLDIAKTRYSVRSYKDKRVEKEKLEQI